MHTALHGLDTAQEQEKALVAPSIRLLRQNGRWKMSVVLAACDLAAVMSAWLGAIALRLLFDGDFSPRAYLELTPLALLFLATYALRGLYPGVGLGPTEELRRLVLATSLVFLALEALPSVVRPVPEYSRFVLAVSWAFSLGTVPLARSLVRRVLGNRSWWGEAVALVNVQHPPFDMSAHLRTHGSVGLRPAVVFDLERAASAASGDLCASGMADFLSESARRNIHCAIVIACGPLADTAIAVQACGDIFERVILVDVRPGLQMAWAYSVDLAGVAGLEIRHNLLNPWSQLVKRAIDLIGSALGVALLLPAFAIAAALIKVDSPGPVIFRQRRVGKGGRHFDMLKLRTMHKDAELVLEECLAKDPSLGREWGLYQKLRNDPRVTRTGSFLRKFSLDELPQLVNVLRGEMSLVGPRPYFPEQQSAYGKGYESYIRVPPGITGIWQVSGRNRATFATRATMDEYYVRNWSAFLDIYLLARTIGAVTRRDGAF